ncbi:MAG: GC-type dockerin domain-anchored protein [Phycisphaerales bacterium]
MVASNHARGVLAALCAACLAGPSLADNTRNIMITGYWPPTNEMLRPFSTNPAQNPGGWIGQNWEHSGYDIYAFFPEFPSGLGQGVGDFEVDYQDTAADWARLVAEIRPVAIITFSRANTTRGWELEPAHQRFRLPGETNPPGRSIPVYTQDYSGVRYPSDVPIAAEPIGTIRDSALPMQAIVDAVRAEIPSTLIDPFVQFYDPQNPGSFDFAGGFLSGYIGYLGIWHHDLNNAPDAPWRCVAAGHVHVGMSANVAVCTQATEISLRVLIDHVNSILPFCPADVNRDQFVNSQDVFDFLSAFFTLAPEGDFNRDGLTNSQDLFDFLAAFFTEC